MSYVDLTSKKCEPCEGGVKPFDENQIKEHLKLLKTEWLVVGNKGIQKDYKFEGFKEAMEFINKVADLAEEEGHHPNIMVNYNKVKLSLWTHSIDGLSINDFILASKIDLIRK